MIKALYVLIAFIIGEAFTAIFLLPTLTDLYEPFKTLSAPLPGIIWIILFLLLPTIIGGVIEVGCIAFLNKFNI